MAVSLGWKLRSSTTCTPCAGSIIGRASADSIARTPSGAVHDGPCPDADRPVRARTTGLRPGDTTTFLHQGLDPDRADRHGAMPLGGPQQADRHARVVELPVVILDASAKPVQMDVRDARDDLLAPDETARLQIQASGERVVQLQTDAVERPFPPLEARHDEGQRMHEVRRVAMEQASFAQRFAHQSEVKLLQITHATVDELGAAAAGPGRPVPLHWDPDPGATRCESLQRQSLPEREHRSGQSGCASSPIL